MATSLTYDECGRITSITDYVGTSTYTYDANGNSYDNRYVMPDGFVSSFVGSMSYYGTGIEPSSLGDETLNVIQGLMVYVYEDRIVFQMKNYGVADMGSYILT